MGITAGVKLNLELWGRGFYKDIKSVAEMGSQEIHMTLEEFDSLVNAACVPGYNKEDFKELENFPGTPRCPAKKLYKMLGAEEYTCVDINSEHGALALDLNYPMEDTSFYNRFDLVTDFGTNEHVFNVVEAYRTMHRICKPGGLIVIDQGVVDGNGYFLFDYSFFEGLAAANNYKIIFASYVISPKPKSKHFPSAQYLIPAAPQLLHSLDLSKVAYVGINYVMQKQTDEDFKYAYQADLLKSKYGHFGYKLQFLPSPPSRSYIPMFDEQLSSVPTKDVIRESIRRIKNKILRFAR
jgi:SAM-dependent methyltransferase